MVPFPPLLAVTLGVLGAAYIVRHFTRDWQRNADFGQSQTDPLSESKSDALPTLRRGADGIYRP